MGTFFILSGMAIIVYSIVFLQNKVKNSLIWPDVTGAITTFDVNNNGKIKVAYEYWVDNHLYRTQSIRPGGSLPHWAPSKFKRTTKDYAIHDEVKVFYNPKKHEEAYLELNEEVSLFWGSAGVILIILGWFGV